MDTVKKKLVIGLDKNKKGIQICFLSIRTERLEYFQFECRNCPPRNSGAIMKIIIVIY